MNYLGKVIWEKVENDIGEGENKKWETSKKTMTKIQPPGHGVSMVEVEAEARLRRMVSRLGKGLPALPKQVRTSFSGPESWNEK